MATDETGLDYERIVTVLAPAALRPALAEELAARPDVAAVAAAWRPPLISPMSLLRVTPAAGVTQNAGFMAVSPGYFNALGVRILREREFTRAEAEQHAALVLVSEATARLFWPGRDPIDQTLDIAPPPTERQRQPVVSRATVIGVVEDVVNGTLLDGIARTSVYFPTSTADPEAQWLLVRTRGDAAVDNRIAKALHDAHPASALEVSALRQHAAIQVWYLGAGNVVGQAIEHPLGGFANKRNVDLGASAGAHDHVGGLQLGHQVWYAVGRIGAVGVSYANYVMRCSKYARLQ